VQNTFEQKGHAWNVGEIETFSFSFVTQSSDFDLLTDDLNDEFRDFVAALKLLLCYVNQMKNTYRFFLMKQINTKYLIK